MKKILLIFALSLLFSSCKTTNPKSKLKVVGSVAAAPDSFSSVIYMGTCTGVRIGKYDYLTAKHCVGDNGWKVEDEIDGRLIYQAGPQHVFIGPITKIYEHPEKDVAILKVQFEEPPLEIAKIYGSDQKIEDVATLTGYGCTQLFIANGSYYPGDSPGFLQVAQGKLIEEKGPFAKNDEHYYVKSNSEEEIFISENVEGPALCPGDSGGGLWHFDKAGSPHLIGIANSIHVYARVSKFTRVHGTVEVRQWIKKSVGI